MVESQLVLVTAILAGETIAQKYVKAGESWVPSGPNISFQGDDAW